MPIWSAPVDCRRQRSPAIPEFLRPLVGAAPAGGAYLRVYAVDIARSPEGQWWVLGDRTQAPSGAGYALENRIALSRAMPDIYRALRVERLAPFFQAFQAELSALNRQDDSRVCVLTPGPLNETYFEHAYLARYLGFLLVEGEDLTVREDGVFIRTVSGLKRAEVLLRRLDSDFADPLELSARSRLGVPGLVQAVRDGTVTIANALGSGVVEARAMLSFLPALAPAVLGQDLAIPNLATWWLGDPGRRSEVLDKLDSVVIGSAFAGDISDHSYGEYAPASELVPGSRDRLVEAIGRRGADFVAQEAVTLSTMPAWHDGRLVPRPFILRLLLARVGDGWRVMPGGFVRVADDVDARAVNLQQGGRTADAWVLSDKPVPELTLLPTPDRIEINRATGALPSRAAANLFWLGRYVERTEATLAGGTSAAQPCDRERRRSARAPCAHLLAACRLERSSGRYLERDAGTGCVRGTAAPRSHRCGALPWQRRTASRVSHPRAIFARRLACVDRPGRADQFAARSGIDRKQPDRARQRCVADHRVLFGPRTGKHEPTGRLALP